MKDKNCLPDYLKVKGENPRKVVVYNQRYYPRSYTVFGYKGVLSKVDRPANWRELLEQETYLRDRLKTESLEPVLYRSKSASYVAKY